MKKTGRPTVYKPEYAPIAHQFCLLGATNENLAQGFGVATSTIDRWIKEIPDFSGALKAGREIADAQVAHSLFQRAVGYKHKSVKLQLHRDGTWKEKEFIEHYPPDATSAIFWLKNRRPDKWREKLDIDQTVIRVRVEGEEESTQRIGDELIL
jgi:hypothetical protein